MRDHQADPADHAGNRNDTRRHEGCSRNHDDADPLDIDAKRAGFIVTKREDADPPPQQDQGARPIRTIGAVAATSLAFTPARLPSSQNVMAGSWS